MDFLILSDCNGVVDMTHEAIARRTNRPIEVIRRTITQLESPDPRSRSAECAGARIRRLDEHRDWGWEIINYGYFRNLASEEQRREKTKARVRKFRSKNELGKCNADVTHVNDFPSPYTSSSEEEKSPEKGRAKDEAEVLEFCKQEGISPDDASWFFWKCEGTGWTNGGRPIRNWKATLRSWKRGGYLPSQKRPGKSDPRDFGKL